MTHEDAVIVLPMVIALANKETIQWLNPRTGQWEDTKDPMFIPPERYRIKP